MGLLPAGERYWRGSPPRAPTWGKGLYARLCLALRPCGNYIWGFAPCPDSRTFLGKSPRDPKKPGRVRYRLSSIDREQGCRTAALLCVLFKLLLTYPAKVLKLQTYSFYQSISIFIVSLPNLSKGCEGATVPAVAALTLPRPLEQMCASCRTHFSVQ